jgi:hypothetical protein
MMNAPLTAAVGLQIQTTVFTVSGTYMPSPGLVSLVVECIGGGGGGGAAAASNADVIVTGGGGGSGGYSRKTLPAALVAGGVIVTVGAGGASNGNGAATSFGALCLAQGGLTGQGNNDVNEYGAAGAGAPPGVGDVTFPGATGSTGTTDIVQTPPLLNVAMGGLGGQIFGGNISTAAAPGAATVGANALPNTGAGGSGAAVNQLASSSGQLLGGTGGSGLCTVTEYIVPVVPVPPPNTGNILVPCWPTEFTNGCC